MIYSPGLEASFSINYREAHSPIVVFDFMVLAHNLIFLSKSVPDHLLDDWYRASWAILINRGPIMLKEFEYIPIVVSDLKLNGCYWRTLEFADYKANRSKTEQESNYLERCTRAGENYCNDANITIFREKLFEADDWAGAIARAKRQAKEGSLLRERFIFLYSVDSDWTQLVDDSYKIVFACSNEFYPLLRGEKEVKTHIKKSLGIELEHPSQLAYFKSIKGDKSDNLPPGSCISLFDLIAKNQTFSVEEQAKQWPELIEILHNQNGDGRKLDHLKKSLKWMLQNGLPLPCSMLGYYRE